MMLQLAQLHLLVQFSPGDELTLNFTQGAMTPAYHNSLWSHVSYNVEIYLNEVETSTEYLLTIIPIYVIGMNNANGVFWNNPGQQTFLIPCNIPPSDYTVRV
jgi:hypothetical protein